MLRLLLLTITVIQTNTTSITTTTNTDKPLIYANNMIFHLGTVEGLGVEVTVTRVVLVMSLIIISLDVVPNKTS